MKKKVIIISYIGLLFICFMICSYYWGRQFYVKNKFKRDYSEYLGKYKNRKLNLIDNKCVFCFENGKLKNKDTIHFKNGLRIIIQLDGNCGKCIYELKKWAIFFQETKFPVDNFIVYVYADNYAVFEYMMFENRLDNSNIVYDADSLFQKANDFDGQDALLKCCLIDDKNKIIAVGSPFLSPYLKEYYLNLLTNLKKNE